MSSLQQQLSAIRAESSQELNLKAQQIAHSRSLIFPRAEAASQSIFDIYQVCVRSFNELCQLDPRFSVFGASLFSEDSMDVERSQLSKDANDKLDSSLENFMTLVGPRLQLQDAQYVMEWLIRRFLVNEYNAKRLILVFLPFHETAEFVTLLHLVPPSKIPPEFSFLRKYQAARASFQRPILLREAIRQPELLSAVNEHVIKAASLGFQTESIIAFWIDLSVQAFNGLLDSARSGRQAVSRLRQDEVILMCTKFLQDGLSLRNVPGMTIACYALATVVAHKADVDDVWIDTLIVAISNTIDSSDSAACLACLAALVAERSTKRNKLPPKVLRSLGRIEPPAGDTLVQLGDRVDVQRLAYGICTSYLEAWTRLKYDDGFIIVDKVIRSRLLTRARLRSFMAKAVHALHQLNGTSGQSKFHGRLLTLLVAWIKEEDLGAVLRKAIPLTSVPAHGLPSSLQSELAEPQVSRETNNNAGQATDLHSNPTDSIEWSRMTMEKTYLIQREPESFVALLAPLTSASLRNRREIKLRGRQPFDLMEDRAYTTFLIRAWCTAVVPLRGRLNAVRAAAEMLNDADRATTDPQGLLPFIICALADQERNVREVAARCILTALSFYNSKTEKQNGPRRMIKGIESPPERTSEKDAHSFMQTLSTHVEACVLDSEQISHILGRILGGHSDPSHHALAKDGKELKTASRTAIVALLAGCAAQSNLISAQLTIFRMLKTIGKVGGPARSKYILPTLREWVALSTVQAEKLAATQGATLADFNEHLLSLIVSRGDASQQFLESIIDGSVGHSRQDLLRPAFDTISRLYRRNDAPDTLVSKLFALAEKGSTDDTQSARSAFSRESFLAIRASAAALGSVLASLSTKIQSPDGPSASKRRRISKSEAHDAPSQATLLDNMHRYTLILEKIEASRPNEPTLLGELFKTLSDLNHLQVQSSARLEYLIQTTIRTIGVIVDGLVDGSTPSGDEKTYQSLVRIDTLIECLRNNSGRGVQNDTLLLISKLAAWEPELVLHSVMPIFTFMGTSSLRQGDDYSAHVIARTIETVLPPLAAELRRKKTTSFGGSSELLLSFTAAFEHIPAHRRLSLFELLIRKLGADQALFAVIAMLVDRYSRDLVVYSFLDDLTSALEPRTELLAFKQCYHLLLDLHAPNDLVPRRNLSEAVFNLKDRHDDQISKTEQDLLFVLSRLMARDDFRRRLSKIVLQFGDSDIQEASSVKDVYSDLTRYSVMLYQLLRERTSPSSTSAQEGLATVLKVLGVQEMISTTCDILDSSQEDIKTVAIQALQDQLDVVVPHDHQAVSALLGFVGTLCNSLRKSSELHLQEELINCIDKITERFGRKDTSVVMTAAGVLVDESILGHVAISVRISALFTLATMLETLREEAVPLIPTLLSQAFAALDLSAGDGRFGELRSAVYAVVNALVECLPNMLSTEDLDRAVRLCHRSASGMPIIDETTNRQQFYELAAGHLSARDCFEAAKRNTQHAIEQGFETSKEHARFVLAALQQHSNRAARDNCAAIFSIIQDFLDIRRQSKANADFASLFSDSNVASIEALAINVAMTAVAKLNDDTLRPHFGELVEWSNIAAGDAGPEARLYRLTSLFNLLKNFMGKMKSLVTAYTSFYLAVAVELLSKVQPTTHTHVALLSLVLDTLSSSFAADESDYWQERKNFDIAFKPLLEQIERFAILDGKALTKHVLPAIRGLVSAAYSSDKRGAVNTEVLKLLRHEDARVRLAAVQSQRQILAQVGEEWVAMVSQMLPFINEAQEDGDEAVERETRIWIKELEEVLGESMAAMLQ